MKLNNGKSNFFIVVIFFLCTFLASAQETAAFKAIEHLNKSAATYSGSAAASWAVSCIPGCTECPECLSSTCSCGCTYFTTREFCPIIFAVVVTNTKTFFVCQHTKTQWFMEGGQVATKGLVLFSGGI